jgi:pimeloyl-ACP methyl ester carboxylesterase
VKELPPESVRGFAEMIATTGKAQTLSTLRELQAFDSRRWLHEIRCPTHVIIGEADVAVPRHHAEMLHRGISNSTLHVISEAGHTLAWTHPAQLSSIITRATADSVHRPPMT